MTGKHSSCILLFEQDNLQYGINQISRDIWLAPDQVPTGPTQNDPSYEIDILRLFLGDEIVCINTQIVHGKTVDEGKQLTLVYI